MAATSLFAHDLFLEPESYRVEPGAEVEGSLFNGSFRHSENTIAADRIVWVVRSGPGGAERLPWKGWEAEDNVTRFRVERPTPAGSGEQLVDLTLELTGPGGEVVALNARVRVGGGL